MIIRTILEMLFVVFLFHLYKHQDFLIALEHAIYVRTRRAIERRFSNAGTRMQRNGY